MKHYTLEASSSSPFKYKVVKPKFLKEAKKDLNLSNQYDMKKLPSMKNSKRYRLYIDPGNEDFQRDDEGNVYYTLNRQKNFMLPFISEPKNRSKKVIKKPFKVSTRKLNDCDHSITAVGVPIQLLSNWLSQDKSHSHGNHYECSRSYNNRKRAKLSKNFIKSSQMVTQKFIAKVIQSNNLKQLDTTAYRMSCSIDKQESIVVQETHKVNKSQRPIINKIHQLLKLNSNDSTINGLKDKPLPKHEEPLYDAQHIEVQTLGDKYKTFYAKVLANTNKFKERVLSTRDKLPFYNYFKETHKELSQSFKKVDVKKVYKPLVKCKESYNECNTEGKYCVGSEYLPLSSIKTSNIHNT